MTSKRRLLCKSALFFISMILLVGTVLFVEADAAEVYSEGLEFTLNAESQSYAVTGIGTCTDATLMIPKEYNNLPVTKIGAEAFFENSSITNVIIPKGITEIDNFAFFGCTSLVEVTIADGVTTIGESAFGECHRLEMIVLPDSITIIEESAFTGNISISEIRIPNGISEIGNHSFSSCESLESVYIPLNVTKIGQGAFASCSSLETIDYEGTKVEWARIEKAEGWNQGSGDYTINYLGVESLEFTLNPDNVSYAVSGIGTCSDVDLIIPSTYKGLPVTAVGHYAFITSSTLRSAVIPDTVKFIGDYSFCECQALEEVFIPDSVTEIGEAAFMGDLMIKKIDIPDSVVNIEDYAFSSTGITEIELPESLERIGNGAFSSCAGLQKVAVPENVKEIGQYAFGWCENLGSITLPFVGRTKDSEQYIGYVFGADRYSENASYIPKALKTVVITGGTKIGDGAFYNCAGLENIIIPDSVISIGNGAFEGCTSLKYSEYDNGYYYGYGDNPWLIFTGVKDTAITSCTISPNTKYIAYSFSECDALRDIVIGNNVISIGDYMFSECEALENVSIGNKVVSIGDHGFYNCPNLTNIVIPDSVKVISDCAFYYCENLKDVELGKGLETIGDGAFMYCKSLSDIEMHDEVTTIEMNAFSHTALEKVVFGAGVTRIEDYAFGKTNISEVSLPEDILYFGRGVFLECPIAFTEYDNALYLGNEENPYLVLVEAKDKNIAECVINSSTKVIAEAAFGFCTGLETVSIPDGVETIGDSVYYGCTALVDITIPGSVSTIGSYPFVDCTAFETIRFEGTIREWDGVEKGIQWNLHAGEYEVYCTNGTILKSGEVTYYVCEEHDYEKIIDAGIEKSICTICGAVKPFYIVRYYLQNSCGETYVLMEEQSYETEIGEIVTAPEAAYSGFYENIDLSEPSGMVTADSGLVLTRYFDRETYTIEFVTNGGTTVANIDALYGAPVAAPANPSRYGYTFGGWYADEDLIEEYVFDTMPLNGTSVYAKWDAVGAGRGIEYTINSMGMYDVDTHEAYGNIPVDQFLLEVEVTNDSSTEVDAIMLVQYSPDGQMLDMEYLYSNTEVGKSALFGAMIDNRDGSIGCIKAFVVPTVGNMIPLAESVEIKQNLFQ